jgi:hypothetical protein
MCPSHRPTICVGIAFPEITVMRSHAVSEGVANVKAHDGATATIQALVVAPGIHHQRDRAGNLYHRVTLEIQLAPHPRGIATPRG